MSNLFKRAAIFTDLHLGEKSNSYQHNVDCENYVNWFLDLARQQECDLVIFLGDWHHQRNSINISTLHFSLNLLEKINTFPRSMFIPGNHDLFYKDKRTISSIEHISKFKNIQLINDMYEEGGVTFVPWLCGNEFEMLKKRKPTEYMMSHLELPSFLMNAMVQMPDHGELRREDLNHFGTVFTGHFHKRQVLNNVHYIGNAFPHNFADAWDDQRGCCIVDWGQAPQYHNWDRAPRYLSLNLSQLLDNPDQFLDDRTFAKVQIDIDISYEEANFIKETMVQSTGVRQLSLIPAKGLQEHEKGDVTVQFESVDQIVHQQIEGIDSEHYNKNLLKEIYSNL